MAITILTWLPFLFNHSVDLTKLIHSTIVDVSPIIVSMTKTAQEAFTKSDGRLVLHSGLHAPPILVEVHGTLGG